MVPISICDGTGGRPGVRRQAQAGADELLGGGEVSKSPSVPPLRLLLELHRKTPDPQLAALLRLTLRQMRTQGLWDHVGSGFFRYTVDPGWQVPPPE